MIDFFKFYYFHCFYSIFSVLRIIFNPEMNSISSLWFTIASAVLEQFDYKNVIQLKSNKNNISLEKGSK